MQRAIFHQVSPIQFQTQATRVLPEHGNSVQDPAVNDEVFHEEISLVRTVFTLLANVIAGMLLLSAMFILPQVLAEILS